MVDIKVISLSKPKDYNKSIESAIANSKSGLIRSQATGNLQPYRIVGGTEVTYNKYPWFAYLSIDKSDGSYMCGGSLIADKFIITAAHCMDGAKSVTIVLNTNVLSPLPSTAILKHGVNIYIHSNYDPDKIENDIAMIELDTSIQDIAPAVLNVNPEPQTGRQFQIIGYGTTSYKGKSVYTYREATVYGVDKTTCESAYNSANMTGKICASVPQGGVDSCQGDSGGPLFNGNKIYGLVSYGQKGCGTVGVPGVYTDVAYQKDFIASVIGGNPVGPKPSVAPVSPPSSTPNPGVIAGIVAGVLAFLFILFLVSKN
jgi:secreted trypsin-like serine protease